MYRISSAHLARAAAAASLLVCLGGAQAQSTRLLGDWQVACDNLRTCNAVGLGPSEGESLGFIDFRREGAPNAEPQASLVFTFETELQELPLEIAFDPPGSADAFPSDPRATIGGDGLLRLEVGKDHLPAFIAALRRAEYLTVRRLDDAPPEQASATISLKGSAAALRWMDEQQRRAGTVTALLARGERRASAVPSPPPAPVIAPSPFETRQIAGKAPPDVAALRKAACSEFDAQVDGEETGYQIAPEIVLWQMPCWRGPYNFSSVFFMKSRSDAAAPIVFERPDDGRLVTDLREIVNGEFSEADRSIFFLAKSRGLGDCGARGAYVWDGRKFALSEWQEMPTCRGTPLDLWPVMWRAQVGG